MVIFEWRLESVSEKFYISLGRSAGDFKLINKMSGVGNSLGFYSFMKPEKTPIFQTVRHNYSPILERKSCQFYWQATMVLLSFCSVVRLLLNVIVLVEMLQQILCHRLKL
ncbi:MAG: hypothetical protein COA36_05345 [Desulfotalea sp.]|nr:MAG: hypothetical protein COA36_05345 [Desulfotalea sp.]